MTLDGIGRGSTPLTVSLVSTGVRRIRVTKDGYLTQERDVQFTGQPLTVTISLSERPPR